MDKLERKLLDTIAMSTVVIALGTLGIMVVEFLDTFESILPMWVIRILLIAIAWTAFYYAVQSVILHHRR